MKRWPAHVVATVAVGMIAIVGAVARPAAADAADLWPWKDGRTVRLRVLGRIEAGLRPYAARVHLSPDGQRYAYVAERDGAWQAVVDGMPGPAGDEVRDLQLAGGTVVYRLQRGRSWHLVRDGELGAPWQSIDAIVVSRDGAQVAYTARGADGAVVVVDGRAGERWDRVRDLVVAGGRWAYVGERAGKHHAVIDGVAGPAYDNVRELAFSGDGRRWAYEAVVGLTQVIVSDRQRWTMPAGVVASDLAWLGGGDLLVWWQAGPDRASIVIEGRATTVPGRLRWYGREHRAIAVGRSGRITYVAEHVRGQYVVAIAPDGQVNLGPRHPAVDLFHASRDGERVAYRVRGAAGSHLVVDGVLGPAHDELVEAGFSPDGRRHAYQAKDGDRYRLFVDGQPGESSDVHDGVGTATWSPDGHHLAYHVLDGDPSVVVDGRRVARVEQGALELHWLAGGARLGFGELDRHDRIVWQEVALRR